MAGWPTPQDQQERTLTRFLLWQVVAGLFGPTLLTMLARPAQVSDKTFPHHLAYLAEACLLVKWLKVHVVHCGLERAFHAGAAGRPPARCAKARLRWPATAKFAQR